MPDFKDLSSEEVEELEEVNAEIAEDFETVNEGVCPECGDSMERIVENKSLFKGSATFHILKFRCLECGKEYLDLDQAEKYDAYLRLKSLSFSELSKITDSASA